MTYKNKKGLEYWRLLYGRGVQRISESEIKKNSTPQHEKLTEKTKPIRIGTWNVRSAFEDGKIHNIVQEIDRIKQFFEYPPLFLNIFFELRNIC